MFKLILAAIVSAGLLLSGPTAAQTAPPKMREVNLTSDSAPGWLPSVEVESIAMQTVERFFSLKDIGDFQGAYAMLNAGTRAMIPLDAFSKDNAEFRTRSGKLVERQILKITWTKNPANAPQPGVYAAIDATARFEGVDRQCGYIILYQSPQGGPLSIMRTENNFMDNVSAKEIERAQSKAAVDQAWAALSTNCPNFRNAGN